MSKVLQLTETI